MKIESKKISGVEATMLSARATQSDSCINLLAAYQFVLCSGKTYEVLFSNSVSISELEEE